MGEEVAGPLAQLLTVPSDGGDDGGDDPLKELKADIWAARGRALLLETTVAGYGDGRGAAPQRDWMPSRTDITKELRTDVIKGNEKLRHEIHHSTDRVVEALEHHAHTGTDGRVIFTLPINS